MRDFAVGEKPGDRHAAELLPDQAKLRAGRAEQVLAAGHAGDIECAARGCRVAGGQAAEHAPQVLYGGRAVAPAKQDRRPPLDGRADRQGPGARIEADDVAHHIVAIVMAGHRQPGQHLVHGLAPVPCEPLAHRLRIDIEGRPAVDRRDEMALGRGHLVAWAQRPAPLGEPARKRHGR